MTLILGPAAAAGLVFGLALWLLGMTKLPGPVVMGLSLFVALLVYAATPLIKIGG